MLAKVRSCAVVGLEGALVEVEVDLSNGLAGFMIVGLPDTRRDESGGENYGDSCHLSDKCPQRSGYNSPAAFPIQRACGRTH